MKRFTAMIAVEGSSSIDNCDGIEYEGRDWLVPLWLDTPDGEWTSPERIVPLDQLPQTQKGNFAGASYVVGAPIPRAVMHGSVSHELADRYGVILSPPIRLKRETMH